MVDKKKLEALEERAEVFMHAAAALEEMSEVNEGMLEDAEGEEAEEAEDFQERIDDAQSLCDTLAKTLTVQLTKRGYVPDFQTRDEKFGDDDEDDSEPSAFA